jgi:DNA-binding transcriptional LysR family regulator
LPDLRHLRAFVAVAEELNFTRAAERLFLGQQAVSKSVGQLERELGVALLERTTREVRLTPAGETLLADGREVLRRADEAFERAAATGKGLTGTVRVGVSPALGPGERAEAVAALREAAPDLQVSLHEVRPRDIAARLREHAIDVALSRTAPTAPEVDSAALRPTPAIIRVAAGHRLAGRGRIALRELDGERLLTYNPPGTPFTDLMVDRVRAAGAEVDPVEARVLGLGTLDPPDAVAIMPAGAPSAGDTVDLETEDDLTLPLVVLWPAGAPSPAVRRIRAALATP